MKNNDIFINALVIELNKVRKFRNIMAHSELELFSKEFIRELMNNDVREKTNKFPVIQYKKGKAIIHLISERTVNNEIGRMKEVVEKLRILHNLIQGDIKLASEFK